MNTEQQSPEKLRELERMTQDVARHIGPIFEDAGACFAVLGFTFGPGGWATWCSNGERADMIRALREMADNLESDGFLPPGSTHTEQ